MSFLDWLLENDKTGHFQAIVAADKADLAAGITWGVYDGDSLIDTAPARYLAYAIRDDTADALNRDPGEYEIRPVEGGDPS